MSMTSMVQCFEGLNYASFVLHCKRNADTWERPTRYYPVKSPKATDMNNVRLCRLYSSCRGQGYVSVLVMKKWIMCIHSTLHHLDNFSVTYFGQESTLNIIDHIYLLDLPIRLTVCHVSQLTTQYYEWIFISKTPNLINRKLRMWTV